MDPIFNIADVNISKGRKRLESPKAPEAALRPAMPSATHLCLARRLSLVPWVPSIDRMICPDCLQSTLLNLLKIGTLRCHSANASAVVLEAHSQSYSL